MDINNELEEGEIEDLSDNDDSSIPRTQDAEEKLIEAKVKKKMSVNDKEIYEMDDFQLLLARHHLIQQQLQKLQGKDSGISIHGKKVRITKRRNKQQKNQKQKPTTVLSEKNEKIEKENEDEDLELLEMRKALLAQTVKKSSDQNTQKDGTMQPIPHINIEKGKVIPVLNQELQNVKIKPHVNRQCLHIQTLPQKPKKKRKRGGKRARLLAYRAQQKKEIEILQQQHAIAFDNYNTVPMDIEDDEENEVAIAEAPLPLMETQKTQPPPPPDEFQPVLDSTSLSMTSSTVAWMPGFVETLESDNKSYEKTESNHQGKGLTKKEKGKQTPTDVEFEETEVWALRAQALKSLACKRASKAKLSKKTKPVKTIKSSVENKLTTPVNIATKSSNITKSVSPKQVVETSIKSDNLTKFKTPVHTPVVIQLGKNDFESSDDEDTGKPERQILLRNPQRRPSLTDEEILNKLHQCTDKANIKIKAQSSMIQSSQQQYKRLNSQLSEKKILFRKKTEEIKTLQTRLQAALREKAQTKREYNTLLSDVKDVRLNLKTNLVLRKKAEEEVLKAKSLISVKNFTVEKNGKINNKMRQHITSLIGHLEESYNEITDQESELDSQTDTPSGSEVDSRKKALQRTKVSVQNMSKEDLSKLEMELRTKLQQYQKVHKKQSNEANSKENKKVDIPKLPSIKLLEDLKNLQKSIHLHSTCSFLSSTTYNLIETLQKNEAVKEKTVVTSRNPSNIQQTLNRQDPIKWARFKDAPLKYKSQLARFRSYRLSPYFRTQSKFSIMSPSFSNKINATQILCKFDINGTCNDSKCSYWHHGETCKLSSDEIIQDLVAYDPLVFDATTSMSAETKQKLLHSFTQQFVTQYTGKMAPDEQLLLLWNQLKEARKSRKVPINECICFEYRQWFLDSYSQKKKQNPSETQDTIITGLKTKPVYHLKKNTRQTILTHVEGLESQEVRYFSESFQMIDVLENSLKENPKDVKLWLSLVTLHLKQSENENIAVENALNVLSRSLEENRDSETLWIEYLNMFSKTYTPEELRELSYQAVMYAATYNVWWAVLVLESSHLGKQEICSEILKFIIESEDNIDFKSNALFETLLYLCKHLEGSGKISVALNCIQTALGQKVMNDPIEKISLSSIVDHLTTADEALLWTCYLSLYCFHTLPQSLFSQIEWGPSKLVNKKNFVLDWNAKPDVSVDKVHAIFHDAFERFSQCSHVSKKPLFILYENLVSFELSLGNIQVAGEIVHTLVKEESLVEAWVLLVLLYVKHSPMDVVVKIAEEALHSCEHDVVVVYFYSNWLYQQEMPRLALEKLTKCIHLYFELDSDESSPDIIYLYRKVLGLEVPYTISLPIYIPKASQDLKFYYWMCYCLLLRIKNIPATSSTYSNALDEAFESSVHQYTSRDNTKKLWEAYIDYKLQNIDTKDSITQEALDELLELITRSVVSVPSSTILKFNSNYLWNDFSFQNKIVEKCLPYIPTKERSRVFEKLIQLMPDNVLLAERVCQHELSLGNTQQVRAICSGILQVHPKCLPLWQTAIAVECKSDCIKEARWMFEEATKFTPFSNTLWSEYARFEIKYNTDVTKLANTLEKLCERALCHGIDLQPFLSKLTSTEEK